VWWWEQAQSSSSSNYSTNRHLRSNSQKAVLEITLVLTLQRQHALLWGLSSLVLVLTWLVVMVVVVVVVVVVVKELLLLLLLPEQRGALTHLPSPQSTCKVKCQRVGLLRGRRQQR
jgi:hypothetical protein